MRYLIELRTSETTAEILERVSADTGREMLPLVSAAKQTVLASRPHPQEDPEILAFLRRLFPDARFNVPEDRATGTELE